MNDRRDDEASRDEPEARFGAVLRRLREQAGLSQRDLAARLHRVASTISEVETGRRLPSVEIVEQYEDVFGLARGKLVMLLHKARAERLDRPVDGISDEHVGAVACPYKGLLAFEYEDAALFFGRESQVERVVARLAEVRFVAVVGASGSGKSSFVRAGLLAGISETAGNRAEGGARVIVLAPGEHPVVALASAVRAATGGDSPLSADRLRAAPEDLGRALHDDGARGHVIVVDQFEELFTLCHDEAERRCFIDALIAAWRDPSSSVVVILALRADFYGRVAAYPQLAAAVVAYQTLIGTLSPADLRRAIELPAARSGLDLQLGLVETMLDDLAGEPGALPLLSHALLETWKRRRRLTLTVGGYQEAGGVRGAIAQTAERTLQSLPESDRAIARSIFLSLTDLAESSEPARRRVDRADLAACGPSSGSLDRVLEVLADARLVTIDERTVVVAHEALIRHWPRLRGWIDTDRAGLIIHRRLTDDAGQWHTLHDDPGTLYRGARLAAARDWAADHADQLSPLERDFLDAGHASESSELAASRRRTLRLRVLASGSAALSVLVAALAVWALDQRREARGRAAESTSLALASSALALLDSRPDVSLLLAVQGYRANPRAEARRSVLAALMAAGDPGVLAILHGHTNPVSRVVFSPDGRTLASSSLDSTIRLWDARRRERLGRPLTGHDGYVLDVAFSPDGRTLASAGLDGTIRLWDVRTREQRGGPLVEGAGDVFSLAFSPDGRMLASAGGDEEVRIWNVHTREEVRAPLRGHTGKVFGVAFSPNSRVLASAGDDNTIRLWNVRTGEAQSPLTGHGGDVFDVAFSPNGGTLASAGDDDTIRLWSVRTREQLGKPLTGHTGDVFSVAFSGDGRRLASGGLDSTVRLWNVRTRKQLGPPLRGHTRNVLSVTFNPTGGRLASASYDGTIRVWNVRPGEPPSKLLKGHHDRVIDVAFSPDERTLASGSDDGTIRLWNVRTHEQLGGALTGHGRSVYRVAFSPDGRTLASASADRTVRLWDVVAGRRIGSPMRHVYYVRSVAFSPDGRTLASASSDAWIRLWDVRTQRQVGALNGHLSSVVSVAFGPGGLTLASAGVDETIRLWNVRSQMQIGAPLTADARDVFRVAFSARGDRLVSDSLQARIWWDVRGRKRVGAQRGGRRGEMLSVASSGDGRRLASPGPQKRVRLWDTRTHQQLGTPLTGQASSARSVVESPNGHSAASVNADNTIRIWEDILWRDFGDLQAKACNLAGGGLSKTEWNRYAGGSAYRRSCP